MARKPALDYLVGIARQQWRARIETGWHASQRSTTWWASPASNGGRGLKQLIEADMVPMLEGIARQQWRARIETATTQHRAKLLMHRPPAMAGAD